MKCSFKDLRNTVEKNTRNTRAAAQCCIGSSCQGRPDRPSTKPIQKCFNGRVSTTTSKWTSRGIIKICLEMRSTILLSELPKPERPRSSYKFKLVKIKVIPNHEVAKVLLSNGEHRKQNISIVGSMSNHVTTTLTHRPEPTVSNIFHLQRLTTCTSCMTH